MIIIFLQNIVITSFTSMNIIITLDTIAVIPNGVSRVKLAHRTHNTYGIVMTAKIKNPTENLAFIKTSKTL